MISPSLNHVFHEALMFAKEHRHEYLTVDHIFLSLLDNADVIAILHDLGCDIVWMKNQARAYLETSVTRITDDRPNDPYESAALSRMIERVIRHVQGSSKGEVGVEDLLAALFEEEQSISFALFEALGIFRVDVLEVIAARAHEDRDVKTETTPSENSESFLKKYSIDLIEQAKEGKIDPVIGRSNEVARVIQVLCRRKKNNPLLVGEPGVGKTAIAEGLALQVVDDAVPAVLKNAKIYALELGAMLAGTKFRGDFEKRLKGVLDEVTNMDNAIIFIDEIHTIVGAGSVGGGSMDASNQLKPALASGKLKCVGATTYSEYRNVMEKDKALSRRFSKVDVDEPSIETTIKILQGLKSKYEEHHEVKYTQKSIKSAVELAKQHIHDRFLPDTAIDLIDEAGASFRLLSKKKTQVTHHDIQTVVAKIANIPDSKVDRNDMALVEDLEAKIMQRVIGQDSAVEHVAKAVKRSYAGLNKPDKPLASFLFTGPTGVGKTELAKVLADTLGVHFERFDMSEYMEAHAVSRLVGAPPGYVGYEQGGLLTESARKHPYMVLLLDEIEKAHPDLLNILLQVMDSATLTDNNGNKANFAHVILIMTSNVGARDRNVMGFASDKTLQQGNALKDAFSPEFRNRIDAIVKFNSLTLDVVEGVVDKFIVELNSRLVEKKVVVTLSDEVRNYLAVKGYDDQMGARPLSRVIQDLIETTLSDAILFSSLKEGGEAHFILDDDRKVVLA